MYGLIRWSARSTDVWCKLRQHENTMTFCLLYSLFVYMHFWVLFAIPGVGKCFNTFSFLSCEFLVRYSFLLLFIHSSIINLSSRTTTTTTRFRSSQSTCRPWTYFGFQGTREVPCASRRSKPVAFFLHGWCWVSWFQSTLPTHPRHRR